MATRFYFPLDTTGETAATVTPSSWSAGWNKTTGVSPDRQLLLKDWIGVHEPGDGSAQTNNTSDGTAGNTTAVKRWISEPLAAQTISGTIKAQFQPSGATAQDFTTAVAVKIIQSDGTDRAVLLAVTASDSTAEPPTWAATATNRRLLNAAESASINLAGHLVTAGDRLVVEIGYRQGASGTVSAGFLVRARAAATDLPEDDTTTGNDLNPWIEFSDDVAFLATPYSFNSVPVDDPAVGTNTADPTEIVPPPDMLAGDLVLMVGQQRLATATLAVSEAGGQSWTTEDAINTTLQTARLFWCTFNGSWSANPSVDFSATTCNSVHMLVFRPASTSHTWSVNQAQQEADFAGTAASITGQTTTGTDPTVTVAGWFSNDDNTYDTLTGTGWRTLGPSQIRNSSGSDQSATFAYKIQTAAGATGNVSKTQLTLGADEITTFIITFAAAAPGPTAHVGEERLNGTGNLSNNALLIEQAQTRPAGAGLLSAYARSAQQIAARFSGSGSLSAEIIKSPVVGEVRFTGTGSLSAHARQVHASRAIFGGVGSFSADATQVSGGVSRAVVSWAQVRYVAGGAVAHQGQATFAGAGNLSANANVRMQIAARFQGAGNFSVEAIKQGQHSAEARFNGAGNLSVNATQVHASRATFAGSGSFSAHVVGQLAAQATFAGSGNLSVEAMRQLPAAATFAGAGSLSINATARFAAQATFAGSGSLSANANLAMAIQARFQGAGNLSIEATIAGAATAWSGNATWAGAGNFSVNVLQIHSSQERFAGAGNYSVNVNQRHVEGARFNGTGSLSVDATQVAQTIQQAEARFAGAGNVSVNVLQVHSSRAIFNGVGNFSPHAVVSGQHAGEARFAGAGSFRVNVVQQHVQGAIFNGLGSLSVDTTQVSTYKFGEATVAGTGNFRVNVTAKYAADVRFTGTGNLLCNVVQRHASRATFAGAGSFSANAGQVSTHQAQARFNGAGGMSVNTFVLAFGSSLMEATFSGRGGMFANVTVIGPRHVQSTRPAVSGAVRHNQATTGRRNAA